MGCRGSFVHQYELGLSPHSSEVLAIKIEVDTNPPVGAKTDVSHRASSRHLESLEIVRMELNQNILAVQKTLQKRCLPANPPMAVSRTPKVAPPPRPTQASTNRTCRLFHHDRRDFNAMLHCSRGSCTTSCSAATPRVATLLEGQPRLGHLKLAPSPYLAQYGPRPGLGGDILHATFSTELPDLPAIDIVLDRIRPPTRFTASTASRSSGLTTCRRVLRRTTTAVSAAVK